MPESPTDFIDFNAWKGITEQSERDALHRQQSDVEAKTAEAERLLQRSGAEAQRAQQQATQGGGTASTTLSTAGSYGDYLKAKQSAINARALMQLGRSGAYGDVRSSVDDEYETGAQSALDRLRAREERTGAAVDGSLGSYNRSAEQNREAARVAAANKELKERGDKSITDKFNAGLLEKMRAQWAEQDSRHRASGGAGVFNPFRDGSQGFGGTFNPFNFSRNAGGGTAEQRSMMGRDAFWGLEDNQRLAQMARAQGLNDEADQYQSTATYDFGGKRTKGGY